MRETGAERWKRIQADPTLRAKEKDKRARHRARVKADPARRASLKTQRAEARATWNADPERRAKEKAEKARLREVQIHSDPTFRTRENARAKKHYNDPKYRARQQSSNLHRAYGITIADKNKMFADQGGVCKVCFSFLSLDSAADLKYRACVDHDHSTGKVRGLLCNSCNFAEGLLRGRPEVMRRMADYVEAAS